LNSDAHEVQQVAVDWDTVRAFLTLADEGKLTAAARRLEVSHPTVARRIKALERSIGARLFDRLPDRFVLTSAGEELLADAQTMERAAESMNRRSAGLGDAAEGTVRLSAGEAMTHFIAERLPRLRRSLERIELELATSHQLANLSRREADLLIREQVPDLASIVTRRLGRVAYAVYASPGLVPAETTPETFRQMPWAGFDDDHAYMPGQSRMLELSGGVRPIVRVNNWLVLREAARAGVGLAVLPCFLGEGEPGLRRVGRILDEVPGDQWLLVHRDIRALPRVRAVMDALIRLFEEERAVLAGRPAGGSARPRARRSRTSA
jgi:DNA-binding transcriptional LysR family regulator